VSASRASRRGWCRCQCGCRYRRPKHQGSIYENQRGSRYFATPDEAPRIAAEGSRTPASAIALLVNPNNPDTERDIKVAQEAGAGTRLLP
jgi:hypothetical protein